MAEFNIMQDKLSNAQIAWRAAQDIEDGTYVNLGIGFPEMIAKFQPEGRDVTYHTENGVLGFGQAPKEGEEDWDLINAGKKPITLKPGAAFFHHADSFAMVRGGHLDLAVLGGIVKLLPYVKKLAVYSGSSRELTGASSPFTKCVSSFLTESCCGHCMATRAEQVRGFIMDSQKPLRLAGGFKPALDLLSFPCRPV
jgi:hypothetical protein